MELRIGLRGLFLVQPALFVRAGARPEAPGARRGPQGAEHLPKTRGRICDFILPEVRQGLAPIRPLVAPYWPPIGPLLGPY